MTMQTASPAMRADYLSRKTDEWATTLEANAARERRLAAWAAERNDAEAAEHYRRRARVLETRARDYREVRAILNGEHDAYILSLSKGNLMIDVDQIIAFESGEQSNEDTIRMFAGLVRSGIVWSLQGTYGRTAADLIEAGIIDTGGNILIDLED